MDAILLAAGKGTRMAPLTPELAKPLLPVAGRSLLHRMLDNLVAAGIARTVVVTHHLAADVAAAAAAWQGKMTVECVLQGEPRGTGHAVAAAARNVAGDALVVMGDCTVDAATVAALARADGFTLAASIVHDPTRFGALQVKAQRVLGIAEKSPHPPSDLVNTGLYRVPADALAAAQQLQPSKRGELEFTDIVQEWARKGDVAWMAAPSWRDIGAPWDLLDAQGALLGPTLDAMLKGASQGGPGTIEAGVHVRGRLWVGAGSIVKAGTYVEGDILVGADARIGPNSYLRGPTVIGDRCHVGAATEVKASLLFEGAHAPHLNYVGDSILGPRVNLGAGATVANLKITPGNVTATGPAGRMDTGRRKFGIVLGADVKVGINASFNPGTLVGAGALIGAGATVSGWVPPPSPGSAAR